MSQFDTPLISRVWQPPIVTVIVFLGIVLGGWGVIVKPIFQDTFIGEHLTPCVYWSAQNKENELIIAFTEFFVIDSTSDSAAVSAAAWRIALDSDGAWIVQQHAMQNRAIALRRKPTIDSALATCQCRGDSD